MARTQEALEGRVGDGAYPKGLDGARCTYPSQLWMGDVAGDVRDSCFADRGFLPTPCYSRVASLCRRTERLLYRER